MPYKVAALGDSLMWGEGLREDQKFYSLVAESVANRLGQPSSPPAVLARCGAVIDWQNGKSEMRNDFADLYPEIFSSEEARREFLDGNEVAARDLFPEIPAPLPVVTAQIQALRHLLSPFDKAPVDLDLLLINGGANDVDFPFLLDPREMTHHQIDELFKMEIYLSLKLLLQRARSKFPKAVIVVPGYFPVLSSRSSLDKVAAFIEWRMKTLEGVSVPSVGGFLSSKLGGFVSAFGLSSFPALYVTGLLTAHGYIVLEKDTSLKNVARAFIARTQFAYSRCQYWMARAVREMNAALGDPPIIFASSRFEPEHSAFAPNSMLFESYPQPRDPMAVERSENYPRSRVYSFLIAARDALVHFQNKPDEDREKAARGALQALENKRGRGFDGPLSLKDAIRQLLDNNNIENNNYRDQARAQLNLEIRRLEESAVASFFHPNARGAGRYAEQISDAVVRSIQPDVSLDIQHLRRDTPNASREAVLERFGLTELSESELTQMMTVDTIAIEMVRPLPPRHYVELILPNAEEKVQRFFAPYGGRLFTIELGGKLHLRELRGMSIKVLWTPPPPEKKTGKTGLQTLIEALKVEPSPLEKTPWDTGTFTLYINGLQINDVPRRYELKLNVITNLRYGAIRVSANA